MGLNTFRSIFTYGLLILIVTIHIISFVLLLNWNNKASLFGTQNWLLNRYYSTKTLHSHTVNSVELHKLFHYKVNDNLGEVLNPFEAVSHDYPTYWNSLGIVTAFEGEKMVNSYVESLPFLNQSQHSFVVCDHATTSKCMLEHVTPELLYVNGDSISILSEISPSLYLGTLLVIYLLSSVKIVATSIENIVGFSKEGVELYTARALYFIIGVIYVSGIVFAFGTTSKLVKLTWYDVEVEFVTTTHLPSILISVFSVFLYYLHLRGRKTAWDDLLVPAPPATESAVVDDGKGNYLPEPISENPMSANGAFNLDIPNFAMKVGGQTKFTAVSMSVKTGTKSEWMQELNNKMEMYHEPISSESSVVGSFTVLLGALGSLGLTRGIMLETETQLIVFCMIAFSVLEVCSHRIYAYYWFIRMHCKEGDRIDDMYFKEGVYFIRAIVLILQMFFILVWMNTVNGMIIAYSALYTLFLAVAILFWIFRAISWIYEVSLYYANYDMKEGMAPGVMTLLFDWTSDVTFYITVILSVSLALFATTQYNGLRADDKLLKTQKIQYGAIYSASLNKECKANFVSSSLLRNILTHDATDTSTKWHENSKLLETDPIDLKVYYWTRWWTMLPYKSKDAGVYSDPSTWFCSSSFEHHHDFCRSERTANNVDEWKILPTENLIDRVLADIVFNQQIDSSTYEKCEGTIEDCDLFS